MRALVRAGSDHSALSAIGIEPIAGDLKDRASLDSPVPFLKGKALTEEHLKRAGMSHTILSPNIFMEVWFGIVLGMPLQAGGPITIVGEGDRKHSFVSTDDVAAFAVAALDNPAARDQQLPGLPDVVAGLLAGMDTYDSPVEMNETAATFEVTLTPADAVLRRMFAPAR